MHYQTQSKYLDVIFNHYEKMTALSGLKLNADKTELIQRGGNGSYTINYLRGNSTVVPSNVIKINGKKKKKKKLMVFTSAMILPQPTNLT